MDLDSTYRWGIDRNVHSSGKKATMTEQTVTISKAEYEQLLEDSAELSRLEAAGVDNWEGY